jgi:mannose-1-phosphate guanylyltransferase/mannose-1-phosphate guanylyltransferase/phosphomannomutase
MEHILRLLPRHGFSEVIANLHWFPDTIRNQFGDGSALGIDLTYSYEEELMGTAGGVRNVSSFFGDDPFLVMAADALTDIDLAALVAAHNENGGIATLAVKRVANVSEFGVVITGADGRIQGFQEKPDPAEALSDLASCMIYILEPEIFDYFPDKHAVDFAREVFPALLENDVPFHVREIDSYWNDVGSLPEYIQGNLDVLEGVVDVKLNGTILEPTGGDAAVEAGEAGIAGRVLAGEDCDLDPLARLDGPLVIGDGCSVGAGARIRHSVLLPGAQVAPETIVAGGVHGRAGNLA